MSSGPGYIRTAVERLSRGRALWRRLPRSFSSRPIRVTPDAALQFMLPGFGPIGKGLMALVDRHITPGMSVWDVGANVGIFALAAADRAGPGRVVAIEPDRALCSLLARTVAADLNSGLGIEVLPVAVSDRMGFARLNVSARGRASNSISRMPREGARESYLVPTVTLDSLLEVLAPPAFVKIDVEGAEALAIRGASRLIGEARPTLYIEVGAENQAEVTRMLLASRYDLFDVTDAAAAPRRVEACVWDTLAVPGEKVAARAGT